jgi:hypothetical protein
MMLQEACTIFDAATYRRVQAIVRSGMTLWCGFECDLQYELALMFDVMRTLHLVSFRFTKYCWFFHGIVVVLDLVAKSTITRYRLSPGFNITFTPGTFRARIFDSDFFNSMVFSISWPSLSVLDRPHTRETAVPSHEVVHPGECNFLWSGTYYTAY